MATFGKAIIYESYLTYSIRYVIVLIIVRIIERV